MALLARRIETLGTENAFSLGVDIQRVLDRGMDVVKLNIGEPDVDSPSHVNRVGAEQILAGNAHYTDPQGIPALRRAIASHVTRTRGVEVDPDRVVVTAGAKSSIGYTMQAYVDPGDEVIYPSPGFPIYESWVTYVGATPRPLHLSEERGFAFTADDLAPLVTDRTKVIVLNSQGLRDDRLASRLGGPADGGGGGRVHAAEHQHRLVRAAVHPGGGPRCLREP